MEDLKLESERLVLRKIKKEDFDEVSVILKDREVMYAWEKGFSNDEVDQWIDKNIERYKRDGYSYLIVYEKKSEECVGLMGPLMECIDNNNFAGIAYILNKKHWGKGYALEGTKACLDYLFKVIKVKEVVAQIKHNNFSSIKVAKNLKMSKKDQYNRIYDGKIMLHYVYSISKDEFLNDIIT